MAESTTGGSVQPPLSSCPWCSAALPDPAAITCPSCAANLVAETEPQIPGVTAVDIKSLALRRTNPPKKSRLVSWMAGEAPDVEPTAAQAPPGSLLPPPPDVRREILRMEMAAAIADLTAEAGALSADEALAAGDQGDTTTAVADIRAEVDAAAQSDRLADDTGETGPEA
jgi:hypothetical protein